MEQQLYTSGEYLKRNPKWHVEESLWKAQHILRITRQNHIFPKTVCEVGCGAGEVLKQLQNHLDGSCRFWGYDVSPDAFELCRSRMNERLHFKLADILQENTVKYDLILVLDVIEHLEDYFGFLRGLKTRADYKVFHIPLDLSVQTILRRSGLLKVRDWYGHIHYFTKELALRVLSDLDYEVVDYCYTARAIEQPTHEVTRNLLKFPRRLLFGIHKDLAARILGGWSLLVLAK
jgi:cyclopropane fatty-acyl-phospholipid synthase-like methyltransferase